MATKATDSALLAGDPRAFQPVQFTFRSPGELCAALLAGPGAHGPRASESGGDDLVLCPSRRRLPAGFPVRLTVRLGGRRPPIELRAKVVAAQPAAREQGRRQGLLVQVEPSSADQLGFVRRAAALLSPRRRRRHDRLAVELPVRFRLADSARAHPGTVRDIGWGGAFVSTGYPVDPSAPVVIELHAPGLQASVDLAGRVVWTGQRQSLRGFGLAWRARDAGGNRRIRELVRRLLGAAASGPASQA